MAGLICSLCPYEQTAHLNLNLTELIKHIQLFHSHDPSFAITCGLDGCMRSFRNFRVFRNHVYSFHRHNTSTNPNTNDADECEINCDDEDMADIAEKVKNDTSKKDLQVASALFLMCLKEKYKLTQVALQVGIAMLLISFSYNNF